MHIFRVGVFGKNDKHLERILWKKCKILRDKGMWGQNFSLCTIGQCNKFSNLTVSVYFIVKLRKENKLLNIFKKIIKHYKNNEITGNTHTLHKLIGINLISEHYALSCCLCLPRWLITLQYGYLDIIIVWQCGCHGNDLLLQSSVVFCVNFEHGYF
ncbi:UNVERIFIED_CONTAM: hypothetical protein NCL1_40998 [Trichonephila clavipes]